MAAKKTKSQRKKESARERYQAERDRIFPERTMTAREEGALMSEGRTPERDWRPELEARFGIDGNLTPRQLDGYDPGEPGRYDYADMQEGHALFHVPLWKIDDSQVKLLLDYGYATGSVFRLGLLIAEEDPFLCVEGSVFGELLPALAGYIEHQYDPVTDTLSLDSEEAGFCHDAIWNILRRAEEMVTDPDQELDDGEIAIFREARELAKGPRRLSMVEAEASVVERRRGGLRVVPVPGSEKGPLFPPADLEADLASGKIRKRKLTFCIIGHGSKPGYAAAFDALQRPVQCDAHFTRLDLAASKAALQTLYGISRKSWVDCD